MMETYGKPSREAPAKGNEYRFVPADEKKPIYYGVCTAREAADHAEQFKVCMYNKVK